ncbi:MAG: tRNA (N(6)-L-threonylcarbamoyladenosine(37)-C(2))-methylthiotransferase MtaB [Planctomycetota bacterium]
MLETKTSPDTEAGTCAFLTFGCKINYYDTEALRDSVLDLGYREVAPNDSADLYVINSCTVTGNAGEKSTAAVRRLARRNPEATIVVTGCMTDEDRTALAAIPGVVHVIGNEEKDQIPALLQGAERQRRKGRRGWNLVDLRTRRFVARTRAFLKIHDGCDEFCSYCVIPHMRGRSTSRPWRAVVEEAQELADSGHRELVLTGIHLSRYGRDLTATDRGRGSLTGLLDELRRVDGIERIRLSSIGEGAFSDEFVALFREDPTFCRFFHIPLQSGSDAVLQRMRRDYSVAEYMATIDRVREQLPDAFVSTDLMIGFPGETEAEFEESLATCRRAAFASMHLFPYSARPKTRAAQLPGHLAPSVKEERMRRAREVEAQLARQARTGVAGSQLDVLVESHKDGWASGLSREGWRVRFAAAAETANLRNHECRVRIDDASETPLLGSWERP